MSYRSWFSLIVTAILFLGACTPAATPHPTLSPPPATTVSPTQSPTSSETFLHPTDTPTPTPIRTIHPTDTPPTDDVNDLRITIIYDNYLQDERLTSEWGFAALVEYQDHVLLFDTGGSATLMSNMHSLDIDPQRVEAVVLSHQHGDHIGGLFSFLAEANQPTVYLLPSFPRDFKNNVTALTEVIEVSESTEIFPDIFSTGQVSGGVREQGLAIRTNKGTVIITGCAHPGIAQMVRRGRSAVQPDHDVDYDPIALVIGGFHLASSSTSQIESIIADLHSLDVQQISPTHCTGDAAIAMFDEAFDEGFIAGGAGKVITLGGFSP